MQPRQRKFSLGAAAFDFPSADDCTQPSEHAPDSWLRVFSTQHADAAVWSGIHTTCRAGQRLALQEAKHVRLRLDCTTGEPLDAWQARLPAVRDALSVRNPSLPTSLTVISNETAGSVAAAVVLPQLLQGAGQCIAALTFTPEHDGDEVDDPAREVLSFDSTVQMDTQFLQRAAQAFPNLRSLTLHNTASTLPPASQWPHLRELSISIYEPDEEGHGDQLAALTRSVAPYLPQLTSLTYLNACGPDWPLLLTPQSTTHTLTTLTTDDHLTDELLGLVLKHAPAVTQLGLGALCIGDGAPEQTWGVERLTVTEALDDDGEVVKRVLAAEAAVLPKSAAGKLHLDMPDLKFVLEAEDTEGIDPFVIERLQHWQVTCASVDVRPHLVLFPADHPAALNSVLRQLAGLDFGRHRVELTDWLWSDDMAQAFMAARPALAHLQLSLDTRNTILTDALVGVALQLHPSLRALTGIGFNMQSDQHANTPWPWDNAAVYTLDFGQVPRLPMPSADRETRPLVFTKRIRLSGVDSETDIARLTQWLQRVDIFSGPDPLTIKLHWQKTDTDKLRAQLTALRAMRFHHTHDMAGSEVVLCGWPLASQAAQELLRQLPSWPCRLRLSHCVWPETDVQSVVQAIPQSYTAWGRDNDPDTDYDTSDGESFD